MKSLINRLQKDLNKLQATIHKEGNDLLTRLQKLDIKDNLEQSAKELEHVVESKLKKFEPAYDRFVKELRSNAKKAGIDITKLEKSLKKQATAAKKSIKKKVKTPATKKTTKKATKKAATKKTSKAKSTTSTATAKKATKKKTKKS